MKKPQRNHGAAPEANADGGDRPAEGGATHLSMAGFAKLDAEATGPSGEASRVLRLSPDVSGEAGASRRQRRGGARPGAAQQRAAHDRDGAPTRRHIGEVSTRAQARSVAEDAVLRRVAEVLDGIDDVAPSPRGHDRRPAPTSAQDRGGAHGQPVPTATAAADVMVLRAGLEDCLCHLAELYGVEILDAFLGRRLNESIAPMLARAATMEDPVMRWRTQQHAAAAGQLLRDTVAAVRRDPTPPED